MGRTVENVQNFKAEPDKKILEFQEILERLITQASCQKEGEDRWRTWMQPSGDSRWQEEKQLHLRRRREKENGAECGLERELRQKPSLHAITYVENQPSLIAPVGQASARSAVHAGICIDYVMISISEK